MRMVKMLLCGLVMLLCADLHAQQNPLYHGLKRKLLYYYDGRNYLYESLSTGINTAALLYGSSAELTAEFRASRYVSVCLNNGFTVKKSTLFQPANYQTKGTFIKLGIRNYLLNSFFPSKLDVFNGLYYIGSNVSEIYRVPGSNVVKSYGDYDNFIALQSGISYRPFRNIAINAGLQYTFFKDRNTYPGAMENTYQPGVGQWKNGFALEPVFTVQYRLPVNLCNVTICCLAEDGEYKACFKQWHKCPRWL